MPAYKTYYEERAKALDSIIEKFRSVQSSNVVDTDKLIRILNCGPICYVINFGKNVKISVRGNFCCIIFKTLRE